jgi:hypothetical protein
MRCCSIVCSFRSLTLIAATIVVLVSSTAAAALYDESVSGDLSSNQSSPTLLVLTTGSNSILGTIGSGGGTDSLDIITLTVPTGMQLTSLVNTVISGTDHQYSIGFRNGTMFGGSVTDSANYVGLAHFGTAATNVGVGSPSGSPTSTSGLDILPVLNSEGVAVGARGFTPPLPPGSYTFAISQLQADLETIATYRFDITVVPEPATLCLFGFGGLGFLLPAVSRLWR